MSESIEIDVYKIKLECNKCCIKNTIEGTQEKIDLMKFFYSKCSNENCNGQMKEVARMTQD